MRNRFARSHEKFCASFSHQLATTALRKAHISISFQCTLYTGSLWSDTKPGVRSIKYAYILPGRFDAYHLHKSIFDTVTDKNRYTYLTNGRRLNSISDILYIVFVSGYHLVIACKLNRPHCIWCLSPLISDQITNSSFPAAIKWVSLRDNRFDTNITVCKISSDKYLK